MEIVIHRVVQGDLQELQPYPLLSWSSQANLGLACEEQTLGRHPALAWDGPFFCSHRHQWREERNLAEGHHAPSEDVLEEPSSVLLLHITNCLCNFQRLFHPNVTPAKEKTCLAGIRELGCQLWPGSSQDLTWTHHLDTRCVGNPGHRLSTHTRHCPVRLTPLPKPSPLILTSPLGFSVLTLQGTCVGEMATEQEKWGAKWAELWWESTHMSMRVVRAIPYTGSAFSAVCLVELQLPCCCSNQC